MRLNSPKLHKHSSTRNLLTSLGVMLIVSALLSPPAATQKTKPTKDEVLMKKALEAAEEKFVTILRNKDNAALSAEISKQGVVPGTDSDRISQEKVKDDLAHNGPIYCMLFDSDCLQRGPANPKQAAVRDILLKAKSIKREISVDNGDATILGDVILYAVGKPEFGSRGQEFCHLVYIHENSEWKIYTLEAR